VDPRVRAAALQRRGLLLAEEARRLPAGQRSALVLVQPRVLVAATQPLDLATRVSAAMACTDGIVLAGRAALWAYGVDRGPGEPALDVAVPDHRQLVLLPPVRVRRVAPSLLSGARSTSGYPVVALETAVVQAAEDLPDERLLDVVEEVLRQRLTTLGRLRGRCRRGVAGSARLRRLLDVLEAGGMDRSPRILRQALEAAGVTGLSSEVPLRSKSGKTAYVDLLHRASGNAVEVDGWATHSRRDRFLADRQRDCWLRREYGITTTRVGAEEVERRLDGVVAELLPLLRRGRAWPVGPLRRVGGADL
jgi:hypothetical protein